MTAEQRRASNPAASVWVSASAGTGKTQVLTDRVLRLLLAATAPQRILCLTFTRAAAAEMANRISRELSAWATAEGDALVAKLTTLLGRSPDEAEMARGRRLFAEVLDLPGGMRIETIHAFCQSLLRRFPVEARVAPHFEVADERTAQELLGAALKQLLRQARRGADTPLADALATVTAQINERTFAELMGDLMRARGRLEVLLEESGGLEGLIRAVCQRLDVPPDADPAAILAAASAEGAFDRAALLEATRALGEGSTNDRKLADCMGGWLGRDAAARAARFMEDYLRGFATRKDTPKATLTTKRTAARHPHIVATLEAEQRRVIAVSERYRAAGVAETSVALIRLGDALLSHYDREKAKHAVLDYDDQILETNRLLGHVDVVPWVLFKLDGGLDHVLIDEAQDTSPEQWSIVQAIAEEFFSGEGAHEGVRTLFAVGDEKQSIFSFQGADPYQLQAMRAYFHGRVEDAAQRWESVPLELSFRSTEAVLAAVDAVFARETARDGVALSGEVIHHDAHRAGQAGLVELWPPIQPAEREDDDAWAPPVERSPADDPEAALARAIASQVCGWVRSTRPKAEGAWLDSRDRQIRPGDVMVLVRRRTRFVDHLVRALKDLEMEVAGVDRMILTEQLAVMDLMALGDFVLLPGDDLTLAVVLKSPLIGFSEDDLFALAHDRGTQTLWRTLSARREENAQFAGAYDALSSLLARADYVPPFEFFADVLGPRGGRRALLQRLGSEAADPLNEFLALALACERAHPPSLQGFLHWLRTGRAEVTRDLEQGRDEVRVMTVHGAKGLQAPIVFLPDTMLTPTGGPRLLWTDGEPGERALLWPVRQAREDPVSQAAHQRAKDAQMEEYRRLLYVAMTRAEDRLYVCGWRGHQKPPEGCWYDLIHAGLADLPDVTTLAFDRGANWQGEALRLAGTQRQAADKPEISASTPLLPATLPDFARMPAPIEPEPPQPLAPSHRLAETPPAESPLGDGGLASFRRGRLVHRLLELLPDVAPEARPETARSLLGRLAADLAQSTRAAIVESVLALLAEPDFAPLFGPGSLAEVPIAAVVGQTAIAGQVDRLLVKPDRVVVVDYKTGRKVPDDEAAVPAPYLAQMAAYRAALRQIFPGRSVDCGLLFADGPRLVWLSEARLDGHAP